jgi:hypothetical protein
MKPQIVLSLLALLFLTLTLVSLGFARADSGEIVLMKTFPEKDGTYEVVDHFLYQITGVNTNATLSVSIDGEPAISMIYQPIEYETLKNGTAPQTWYTWQITIPLISVKGNHSFQFFSHYYVWQDVDNYWAEFNSYSTKEYFSIIGVSPTISETKTTPEQTNQPNIYVIMGLTTPIPALLLVGPFWRRHRIKRELRK